MNLLQRVSATLSSTASHTVARFENHRAIGRAAIDRAREGVAAARAAERRHHRQGDALTDRRTGTQAAIDDWSRRARHAEDDATALQCLQRRHEERERLAILDEALRHHAVGASRLSERLRDLERGLDTLTERYEALASRETFARADAAVERLGEGRLDEAFERWETRVDRAEMAGACAPAHGGVARDSGPDDRHGRGHGGDAFEHRFVEQERHHRFADELQALRAEAESKR